MEQSFDLSDSTDWIDTPLNLLGPLESSLRCQICKDFFTSPVLTSCCHTFCSLCIRRCLSNDQKCPVCRQNDQELKLRRNWQVEEFVENFKKARQNMLELARKEAARIKNGTDRVPEPSVKKRKVDHSDQVTEAQAAPRPRRVRTRSRTAQVETDTPPEPEIIEDSDGIEVIQDSQDEEEEYVPDDGLVECPLCQRKVKIATINAHIDSSCQDLPKPSPPKPSPSKTSAFGALQRRPQDSQTNKLERLPAINYGVFKENALRKKLRDLGISDTGPKILLQRRHTEWMNLWNSNYDSKRPKSKPQLMRELDTWERTQGMNAAPPTSQTNPVASKDFNAAEWSTNHNDEFKLLIANARKKSEAQVRSTIPRAPEPTGAAAEPSPADVPAHVGSSTADPSQLIDPST